MKVENILGLALVGYGVYYITQIGIASGTIKVIFKSVSINGLVKLRLTLTVQNVSNISIKLNSMTGDVNMNYQPLGTISYFGEIEVPANQQIDVPVDMDISLLDLPSNLASIISSGGSSAVFDVNGFVNLNGFVLPFGLNKNITV